MTAPAGFTSWLDVRLLHEWDSFRPRWVLTKPLTYYSAILERVLIVPVGFVFDGESAPASMSFTGPQCFHAGALHDWLYASHQVTKDEADAVYAEALASVGLDPYWVRQRHHVVTFYGQGAWDAGPTRLRMHDVTQFSERPYGALDAPKPEPNVSEASTQSA